jgi:hypothetical protein
VLLAEGDLHSEFSRSYREELLRRIWAARSYIIGKWFAIDKTRRTVFSVEFAEVNLYSVFGSNSN